LRGIDFEKQVPIPLIYKGEAVEAGFRVDVLVEKKVIVEIKAVDRVLPVHEAQLLTYVRLTGKRVGLLLNFKVVVLKNGIHRKSFKFLLSPSLRASVLGVGFV
jgi:GxxExxY protein